mmetsp:Transcript_14424/g.20321  ORF Transcript_14424/g.20321 Transcript_14424/m.20321 type:complete len:823 (-) Transcript_14424:145-2613(-)
MGLLRRRNTSATHTNNIDNYQNYPPPPLRGGNGAYHPSSPYHHHHHRVGGPSTQQQPLYLQEYDHSVGFSLQPNDQFELQVPRSNKARSRTTNHNHNNMNTIHEDESFASDDDDTYFEDDEDDYHHDPYDTSYSSTTSRSKKPSCLNRKTTTATTSIRTKKKSSTNTSVVDDISEITNSSDLKHLDNFYQGKHNKIPTKQLVGVGGVAAAVVGGPLKRGFNRQRTGRTTVFHRRRTTAAQQQQQQQQSPNYPSTIGFIPPSPRPEGDDDYTQEQEYEDRYPSNSQRRRRHRKSPTGYDEDNNNDDPLDDYNERREGYDEDEDRRGRSKGRSSKSRGRSINKQRRQEVDPQEEEEDSWDQMICCAADTTSTEEGGIETILHENGGRSSFSRRKQQSSRRYEDDQEDSLEVQDTQKMRKSRQAWQKREQQKHIASQETSTGQDQKGLFGKWKNNKASRTKDVKSVSPQTLANYTMAKNTIIDDGTNRKKTSNIATTNNNKTKTKSRSKSTAAVSPNTANDHSSSWDVCGPMNMFAEDESRMESDEYGYHSNKSSRRDNGDSYYDDETYAGDDLYDHETASYHSDTHTTDGSGTFTGWVGSLFGDNDGKEASHDRRSDGRPRQNNDRTTIQRPRRSSQQLDPRTTTRRDVIATGAATTSGISMKRSKPNKNKSKDGKIEMFPPTKTKNALQKDDPIAYLLLQPDQNPAHTNDTKSMMHGGKSRISRAKSTQTGKQSKNKSKVLQKNQRGSQSLHGHVNHHGSSQQRRLQKTKSSPDMNQEWGITSGGNKQSSSNKSLARENRFRNHRTQKGKASSRNDYMVRAQY